MLTSTLGYMTALLGLGFLFTAFAPDPPGFDNHGMDIKTPAVILGSILFLYPILVMAGV